MKPERYMVAAVPIGGGERVTGHLYYYSGQPRVLDFAKIASFSIDPDTIEPLKLKVIQLTADESGVEYEFIHFLCPNCENIVHQHYRRSRASMRYKQNYCVDCGQALDWDSAEKG